MKSLLARDSSFHLHWRGSRSPSGALHWFNQPEAQFLPRARHVKSLRFLVSTRLGLQDCFVPPASPDQGDSIPKGNKTLQLSYTLTINENYRVVFEQVELLEGMLKQFIEEIKESFPLEKIQCYLDSYPRLAFKESCSPEDMVSLNESSPMTPDDIFSEVEDILIVDEMKNLFA